jgi:hypothetical protein
MFYWIQVVKGCEFYHLTAIFVSSKLLCQAQNCIHILFKVHLFKFPWSSCCARRGPLFWYLEDCKVYMFVWQGSVHLEFHFHGTLVSIKCSKTWISKSFSIKLGHYLIFSPGPKGQVSYRYHFVRQSVIRQFTSSLSPLDLKQLGQLAGIMYWRSCIKILVKLYTCKKKSLWSDGMKTMAARCNSWFWLVSFQIPPPP